MCYLTVTNVTVTNMTVTNVTVTRNVGFGVWLETSLGMHLDVSLGKVFRHALRHTFGHVFACSLPHVLRSVSNRDVFSSITTYRRRRRHGEAVVLSTGAPLPAQWACRRRCRYVVMAHLDTCLIETFLVVCLEAWLVSIRHVPRPVFRHVPKGPQGHR